MQVLSLVSVAQANVEKEPVILTEEKVWEDESGKKLSLSEYSGKLVVLTMLYTECKKTCPFVTMKALKDLKEYMDNHKLEAEYVVATLDPVTDTPNKLKQFKTKQVGELPNWHFIRSSKEETRRFAKTIGLGNYWEMDDHIVHGFKIFILDKQGATKKVIDWDHKEVQDLKID